MAVDVLHDRRRDDLCAETLASRKLSWNATPPSLWSRAMQVWDAQNKAFIVKQCSYQQ
ncbi:hypothetical protein ANO11243_068850 [Dothideomycetidae sp. 11243]|nr:hypothetical protein ANO11243_068850 [fungal sp. No.11243]